METGKGGWGWEEDRSEQVVWASGAGGEVREKAEEEPEAGEEAEAKAEETLRKYKA